MSSKVMLSSVFLCRLSPRLFNFKRTNLFFISLHKNVGNDIRTDKRAVQKLRREVEKAKRTLSSAHHASIYIEALHHGIDFMETLSRAKFEELNKDLFKSTLKPVKQVLDDSNLKKSDIDEIVLVGGSTRIQDSNSC